MSNEELDKLFKNKFDNREVPFDESAWQDAMPLIDAHNKKRRRKAIFWILITALAIGSGVTFWLTQQNSNSIVADNKTVNEQVNKNRPKAEENINESITELEIKEWDKSADNKLVNQQKIPHQGKGNMAPTSKQSSLPDDGILTGDGDLVKSGDVKEELESNKDVTSDDNKSRNDEHIERDFDKKKGNDKNEKVVEIAKDTTSTSTQPILADMDTVINADSMVLATEEEKDTATDEVKEGKKEKEEESVFLNHRLGLIVGASNISGLQNTESVRAANAYTTVWGVGYTYSYSGRWSFDINALYYTRGGLNSSLNSNTVSYGFGYDSTQITEQTQKLTMLDVPLIVNYNFMGNHYFQLGASASMILNSESILTTESTSTFGDRTSVKSTETGYRQGFENATYNLIIGYRYRITDRLSVDARAVMGLNDMTKNNVYNNTTFDRNMQYGVVFRYDIIKKRYSIRNKGYEDLE